MEATTFVGWTDDTLWIIAQMADDDVFSHATEDNQRTWELGDVFEVFWKAPDEAGYHEFHVTPTNCRMALGLPSTQTIGQIRSGHAQHEDFLVAPDTIQTLVTVSQGKWIAHVLLPRQNQKGDLIQMSFCRYDAHRDGTVDFYSSSPHPVPDFHRPQDWPSFVLV